MAAFAATFKSEIAIFTLLIKGIRTCHAHNIIKTYHLYNYESWATRNNFCDEFIKQTKNNGFFFLGNVTKYTGITFTTVITLLTVKVYLV